jgi:DNA-binding beta-propeller fold protein YncE
MKRLLLPLLPVLAFMPASPCAAAESARQHTANKAAPRPFATLTLGNPRGLAIDPAGNLYVGDVESGLIHKIAPSGQVTKISDGQLINNPIGLAADGAGNVFVADADSNGVYKIAASAAISAVGRPAAGEPAYSTPTGVAVDREGNIYVSDNSGASIRKIARDNTLTTFAGKSGESGSTDGSAAQARFTRPRGIASDADGNLYVADEGDHTIRKITRTGMVSTLAGHPGASGHADGPGKTARFAAPRGLTVDAAGNVYVIDTDNHAIRKITPGGDVSTLAGSAGDAGSTDGPGRTARFSEPRGIAVDAVGNVFVADTGNGSIRQIAPDGTVSTIAGSAKP